MILLHCTQKMMAEIGFKERDFHPVPELENPLSEWYAHIIHIDHKKCALFVNGATRASFLIGCVSREELRQLPDLFAMHWRQFLVYEGFPASVIETILAECSEFTYGRVRDKSILGSMNDIARHYRWHF